MSERKKDYLVVDKPIPNQKYFVISLVNPKDRVLLKNLFYVNKFLVKDVNQQIVAQASHMAKKLNIDMRNKISGVLDRLRLSADEEDKHLYRILSDKFEKMLIDEDEFIHECHRKYTMDEEEILDKYKIFISQNRKQIDSEFDDAYTDETSVRGIKIRGAFKDKQEANERCEFVRANYERGVCSYVAEMGKWIPVDFENDEIQDQDYMLPQLNELMGKYHEGIKSKDAYFEERKRNMMEYDGQKDTKSRLREKLNQRRKDKIRREIQDFQDRQDGSHEVREKDSKSREAEAEHNAQKLLKKKRRKKNKTTK
jgi:hypothetical protein